MKTNKNLKPIRILKTKKKPYLLSFIDKMKEDKKKVNLIPLTYLLNGNYTKDFHKVKSFSGININENRNSIIPNTIKNTSLKKYKSISQELLPIKYTKLKLPRIKQSKGITSELKESKIESIMNKFHQYDYKFKTESKNSFDFNNQNYLRYNYNFSNVNILPKYNYKKIYSKLFKKIKEFKSL